MCDPVSIIMGIGTAVSVVGGFMQAQAAQDAADANAEISRQNAIIAQRRATDALERGQLEEERKLREGTFLEKEQEARYTAANIDMSYGTPLDVILSTAMEADMDAAIIRSNAEREAEDFEFQAHQYRSQAGIQKAEGKAAKIGGIFGAIGTGLSGASSVMKYRASSGGGGSGGQSSTMTFSPKRIS